jgi:hypothetical protein
MAKQQHKRSKINFSQIVFAAIAILVIFTMLLGAIAPML